MKLLWLGNSEDVTGAVPEAELACTLVARRLGDELGEPVELIVKAIWPTAKLSGFVERWMEEERPDLVFIRNTYYLTAHASVPMRVRRLLGPVGRPIAKAGERSADVAWLAHSRPYHLLRGLALHTIGGDPPFPVNDLIERMSDVTRIVVRHENVVPAVIGPEGNVDYGYSRRSAFQIEQRRMKWHRAMEQLCAELHIEYLGFEEPYFRVHQKDTLGDRVHSTAGEYALKADYLFEFLLRAWTNAGRAAVPAPAAGEG